MRWLLPDSRWDTFESTSRLPPESVGVCGCGRRLQESQQPGESERAKGVGELGQAVSLAGAAPLGILPTFPRCFLRAQGDPEDVFMDPVLFLSRGILIG